MGARLAGALIVLGCALVALPASAQGWRGRVGLWGNYYWETSTRVVAPEVSGAVTTPDGVDIRGTYLLDAITSASIASGVIEDIRFTEVRNQGTLGFGREFDLGQAQLRLDLNGRMSHEPDYFATGLTLSGALSLAERCSVIGFSLGYIHDDVGRVIRGGAPRTDGMGGDLSNRGRVGELEGVSASLSFTQILSEISLASIGYDLVHNWGYLANPYRTLAVEGAQANETHPGSRTRHSLYGRVQLYAPESRTAFHVLYRVYLDDWELGALTPEGRIYQEIGDALVLRVRYRYYNQLRSFFWRPVDQFSFEDPFLTADPKMAAFQSHLLGVHARISLGFLGGSPLGFLEDGAVVLNFDYLWQGSRFGDGVIAQVGVDVPLH
jgi:hypothetical protein